MSVLGLAIRATFILAAALVAARLLRHRSAALRHLILTTALLLTLALPLFQLVPAAPVAAPPATAPLFVFDFTVVAVVWLAGVIAGTVRLIANLARLRRLRRESFPWMDRNIETTDCLRSRATHIRRFLAGGHRALRL